MAVEEQSRLTAELNKLLPDSFPDVKGELQVTELVRDFTISKISGVTEDSETENSHPLFQIYRKKNWKELAAAAEQVLSDAPADTISRLYWISAQLHLKNIPAEIVAGTFADVANSESFNSEICTEHWGVISGIWAITSGTESAIRLTPAYKKLSELYPQKAEGLYRNYLESQYRKYREASESAVSDSEEVRNLKYISELRLAFFKKEHQARIEPIVNSRKSHTAFYLLLLFTILLAGFFFSDIFEDDSEPVVALVKSDENKAVSKAESQADVPKVAEVTQLPESKDSSDLDSVLVEIEKDRSVNQKKEFETAVKDMTPKNGAVSIDLSGPKEPPEIAQMIESGFDENLNPETPPRGQHIVEGEDAYNTIVPGEAIAGSKYNLNNLEPGDILIVKRRTSLYAGPDEIEAELLTLKPDDKLEFIRDYKSWVRVKFGRHITGFVKKTDLAAR